MSLRAQRRNLGGAADPESDCVAALAMTAPAGAGALPRIEARQGREMRG